MILSTKMLLAASLFALVWSLVVSANALRLGTWLRVLDKPDPVGGRKRHDKTTPMVGGIGAVLPAIILLFSIAAVSEWPNQTARGELVWIGAASLGLMLVGLFDDRYQLTAKFRLAISCVVFSLLMFQVPDLYLSLIWVSFLDRPLILGLWGGLLSTLCLVGFLNALNMMDGKNGLVIGLSLFWSIALLVYAPGQLKPVLLGLTIALTVILWFNLKGQLFLGDSGSYALSGLIGILTIYIYSRRPDALDLDQIVLWLSLPVMDCVRVMTSRVSRGLSVFHPGRDHFHHYLSKRLGWERGKYVCWGLVWVPGVLSLMWPSGSLILLLGTILAYAAIVRQLITPRVPTLMSAN
jgi:UDP-GlcNAc:undecaprenyl-phosphate/decaprenyl-phosphate GlcNAc-1-phosphate transferase